MTIIRNKSALPLAPLLAPSLVMAAALLLSACAQQAVSPEATAAAKVDNPAPTVSLLEFDKMTPEDRVGLTVHFARVGDLAGLKRLLDAGADVNGRDELDQTPLIAAVSQDSLAGVTELLRRGASVASVDKAGWTPLHFATFFSTDTRVMQALLDAGANVNARNDRGITALYFAAATGHEDQVKLLLSRGADQSIASNSGWTPLRVTRTKGIESITRLLDPNGKAAAPVSGS